MKYAWVLPGGGFRGAYQVGAINALLEAGLTPAYLSCISTGTLQGLMVAQGKYHLLNYHWNKVAEYGSPYIWESWLVKEKDGSLAPKVGGLAEVIVAGRLNEFTGLGSMRPLERILLEDVQLEKFQIPCVVGFTSLTDGKYYSVDIAKSPTVRDAVNAALASATMPIIWEPVKEILTETGVITQGVDGGLTHISPLGEAIDYINSQPDSDQWTIIIIRNSVDGVELHPATFPVLGVAGRTMEVVLDALDEKDFKMFNTINRLVQASGQSRLIGKRYVPSVIIQPSQNLGSTLDSRTETIRFRRSLGYQDAMNTLTTSFQ